MGKDGPYAVVYSNGRKIRPGYADSDEAQQNYRRFLAEGATLPVSTLLAPGKNRGLGRGFVERTCFRYN